MRATSFAESIESMVSWSNVSLQASLTHFVQPQAASSPSTKEFQPCVNSSAVISANVSHVSASQASTSQKCAKSFMKSTKSF